MVALTPHCVLHCHLHKTPPVKISTNNIKPKKNNNNNNNNIIINGESTEGRDCEYYSRKSHPSMSGPKSVFS